MDLIVEEVPQDIPKESKVKKAFIFFIGFFLVFLMLSYAAISYGVGDVLAGFAASSLIENNRALFKNGEILFLNNSYEGLVELWHKDEGLEFKACFLGKREGEVYFVTSLFQPKMFDRTYRSVAAEDCPPGTLISAHSHPFRRCIASLQDVMNHHEFKERNPNAIMAILCDENRINVYP